MKRQENLDYLANAVGHNKKMFDSLYALFFRNGSDIEACAKIAYRDLQRNLGGIGTNEAAREGFINGVVRCIGKQIEGLLAMGRHMEEDQFNTWHSSTCVMILDISQRINPHLKRAFTYGLAQKWLNMTLKTMLVAEKEKWWECLDETRECLHVPVDRYIIAAAHDGLGIRDENKKKYPSAWSKWDDKLYIDFQTRVRKAVRARDDYTCPIDWEFDTWISFK